jgi:DNA modification methylase
MKPKDLMGIPHRLAFALRADGWYLRADIPWLKANAMPESVRDRPTKAHEYLFLLSKSERYFYDREAILMNHSRPWWEEGRGPEYMTREEGRNDGGKPKGKGNPQGRNRRTTDWYDLEAAVRAHKRYIRHLQSIRDNGGMLVDEDGTPLALFANTSSYGAEHYAPFPPDLAYPCILGGSPQRGICPLCRSPWERVVEREAVKKTDRSEGYATASGQGSRPQLFTRRIPKVKTAGWVPSCDCWQDVVDEHEEQLGSPRFSIAWLKENDPEERIHPRPALILDPFSGTGTTGEVCRSLPHPRDYVGLDINDSYNRKIGKVRAENTETEEAMETLPLFAERRD